MINVMDWLASYLCSYVHTLYKSLHYTHVDSICCQVLDSWRVSAAMHIRSYFSICTHSLFPWPPCKDALSYWNIILCMYVLCITYKSSANELTSLVYTIITHHCMYNYSSPDKMWTEYQSLYYKIIDFLNWNDGFYKLYKRTIIHYYNS